MKTRVIVESPFAGDVEGNRKYLFRALRDCMVRGEVPFASHAFFTQFLNDNSPSERKLGIEAGYEFWIWAEKIVFYCDKGMSPGMQAAWNRAEVYGMPTEVRYIGA